MPLKGREPQASRHGQGHGSGSGYRFSSSYDYGYCHGHGPGSGYDLSIARGDETSMDGSWALPNVENIHRRTNMQVGCISPVKNCAFDSWALSILRNTIE